MGAIKTGIEFESLPGCIPVFYEVAACNAANYRYYGDWQELTPRQQSTLIGHYLSTIWVANNQNDAEYRHQLTETQKRSLRAKG